MWEQALNKATEVSTSDSILDNLQMEDSIEGEGGEDGIFCTMKLKLIASSMLASQ